MSYEALVQGSEVNRKTGDTGRRKRTLAEFVTERKGALLHYIRSRVSDYDAEDILQDAITGVLSSGEIGAVDEVSGCLFRSVRNKIIDRYRKREREVQVVSGEYETFAEYVSDVESGGLHEALERKELREALFNAIDSLAPHERAVWMATELEGHSFAELSVLWEEPIGTLLSRKSRASAKLRAMLAEYNPGLNNNDNDEEDI